MYNLSKDDLEFLLSKFKTQNEIAEYLGVSKSSVSEWLKEYGINKNNKNNKNISKTVSDTEFKEVCKKAISMRQASIKLGIPFTSFKRRAEKLGCYKTNQPGVGIDKEYKSNYSVNEEYFNIWTPQMAYWYGFLVADGGIVSNSIHSLRLRLSGKYEYVLERFKKDISFTGPILRNKTKANSKSVKYYDFSEITINNKNFVKSLKEKGIVENKTYKDIKYIDFVPNKFRPYFLVGLFDGDGNISKKDGLISIAGNKINVLSTFNNFGFTIDKLRIEYNGNYVDINIRFIKDRLIFYKIYLECAKNVSTLNHKRELIEYFYGLQSKRHPDWV